jgi:hypothetical protein
MKPHRRPEIAPDELIPMLDAASEAITHLELAADRKEH